MLACVRLDSLSTRLQASLGSQAKLSDQIKRLKAMLKIFLALALAESEKTALEQRFAIEIDKNRAATEAAEAYRLSAEKEMTTLRDKLSQKV